jgi:FMN phosphatase YigB (HAD superfamily)
MEKPDPEIYSAVLNDLNCEADEAIFIDDKEENVNSAREMSINSILYKNFRQLKKDLIILGVSMSHLSHPSE